ncbi:zinc ribbon domain-containing protein [Bradyrhizobium elkanii]|uniref:zinc ribbon domain-containing protein n=1 Tax=Bradyrhizobium elkanii TaxID=29448 RepID=UPI00159F31DE|nr:zinc ribbon domain-containing protein [Bradyrhizobium elkanii]
MIQDHHVGYISWDQFVVNRDRLAKNRTNAEGGPSPAREGLCLVQGLLICGVCGRRIGLRYTGNGGLYPMYQCVWKHRNALASRACLNVPSAPLDETIAERLVDVVTPVTLELALAAEERDRQIGTQWRMRIDRARYETELAERRYEAVDPANRLIAATLEQRWNDALQRLQDLETELAAFERRAMRAVTAEQKKQIPQLAGDFPRLWRSPTTTPRDANAFCVYWCVTSPEPKVVRLHVRWQGGATETLQLQLPPNRADVVRYPEAFVARIRELAIKHYDDEIVALLRAKGQMSSTGKPHSLETIKWIRYKNRIPAPRPTEGLSVHQVSKRYAVSPTVVYYWLSRGAVTARRRKPNTPYHNRRRIRSTPTSLGRQLGPPHSIIPNANCIRCTIHTTSGYRVDVHRRRASKSSPARRIGSVSLCVEFIAQWSTMLLVPTRRFARKLFRPLLAHPRWRGPACRHGSEYPRGRSFRTVRRSGRQAPPLQ